MMPALKAQYISASRRTDIPRFFYEEFFRARDAGHLTYDGGYGRQYTVSLLPEHVLGYIFWSKDFSPFISHPRFPELIRENNAIFHFTLNHAPALEPGLAPLDKRLAAMVRLCELAGPERVLWRYDPLCKYQLPDNSIADNLAPFFQLLPFMQQHGIRRCYFSFMTSYNKLKGRQRGKIRFLDLTGEERLRAASAMQLAATQAGVTLFNCCNPDIHQGLPEIQKAHCVEDELLRKTDRFGVHAPLAPHPTRNDCGCHQSRDIGSYSQQCLHGCYYCYANPRIT